MRFDLEYKMEDEVEMCGWQIKESVLSIISEEFLDVAGSWAR